MGRLEAEPQTRSGLDVIRQTARLLADEAADGRLVLVESTTLDIDRGEPGLSHVRAALEAQMHVVTVNKGPAAFAYDELESLACVNAPRDAIERAAAANGMRSLWDDGIAKAAAGLTSIEELARVVTM